VDIDADVIVLGNRRGSDVDRGRSRGVTDRVLGRAHCPVLVVVPKDYAAETPSARVAPVCEDCIAVRERTHAESYWCERHARDYVRPRLYIPTDPGRHAIMSTY
jgi:hypothetical protein